MFLLRLWFSLAMIGETQWRLPLDRNLTKWLSKNEGSLKKSKRKTQLLRWWWLRKLKQDKGMNKPKRKIKWGNNYRDNEQKKWRVMAELKKKE